MRTRLPTTSGMRLAMLAAASVAVTVSCDSKPPVASRPAGPPAKPVVQTVTEGDVTLRLAADVNSVRVGDPLTLRLTLDAAADVQTAEPPTFDELADRFAIRRRESTGPIAHGAGRRWEFTVAIAPDAPDQDDGGTELPGFVLKYTRAAATRSAVDAAVDSSASAPATASIASKPFSITVLDPGKFDAAALPKTPLEIDLPYDVYWRSIIYGLVAAALLVGAWWYLRKRRGRTAAPVAPAVPPHDWALRELHRLAIERLPEQDRFQEYYFRLSGIVREYIERRFGLSAPDRTTEEFLLEMKDHPALESEQQSRLGEFLSACDQVKFARYAPDVAESKQALANAREFVDVTTPNLAAAATAVISEAA